MMRPPQSSPAAEPGPKDPLLADYLRREAEDGGKHELRDGRIVPIPAGSPAHARMAGCVIAQLYVQLQRVRRRCTVYTSDARVRIAATGFVTYPDATVVQGKIVPDELDPQAITNPIVLVEILCRDTELYDRGPRIEHYKRIPTLKSVVLVSYDRPQIDVISVAENGWAKDTFKARQQARIPEIGCTLDVDVVFSDSLG